MVYLSLSIFDNCRKTIAETQEVSFLFFSNTSKPKSSLSETKTLETFVNTSRRKSAMTVDISVKFDELTRLREKCNAYEESECTLKATVEHLKFELSDKEDMNDKLSRESQTYQMDLETYIAKSKVNTQITVAFKSPIVLHFGLFLWKNNSLTSQLCPFFVP